MKTKKRVLGILLSLALVLGLMPGMSMVAYAAETTVTWDYSTWKAMRSGDTTNGITFTGGRKSGGNLYDYETTVFTAPTDSTFTKIEFLTTYTSLSANSANTGTFSVVDYTFDSTQDERTVNGKKVTWTGESDTVSFTTDTYAIEYIKFTLNGPSVDVESVTLDKTSATLTVGDTETLTATVSPDDADDKTVIWSSDNTAVATVSKEGVVTAVAAGTATITATADNGTDDTGDDVFATCKVTVNKAETTGEKEIATAVNKDDKSPEVKPTNLTNEVVESTLSIEEKTAIEEALNNGEDVKVDVYLEIKDISDTISASDQEKVKAAATDADKIEFFDISLLKEISISGRSREPISIHDLTTPLKLTIGVPSSFPTVADGYTRTYAVLRLHEGSVTVLPTTLNADGTLSFETDRFSTYALAYTDTKENTSETTTTEATTATATETAKTSPKTGDSMPITVMVVLMFAAAGMLVFMDLKKKKN